MKVPKHFLVIVPGFMGSKLRDKNTGEMVWVDFSSIPFNPFDWEKWLENLFSHLAYPNDALKPVGIMDEVLFIPPWAKQEHYGRLIKLLETMGYKADPKKYNEKELDVYMFSYDWRQDNRLSARQLAEAIAPWKNFHPKSKAWIIAHSNGGVVSRWYIEKEGGKDITDRLFLFGSPRDGTPRAFQILHSGLDTLFRRRFALFNIPEMTQKIIRTFPSIYQLIPIHNPFLMDIYNEHIDLFTDMTWLVDDQQKKLLHDGRRFNIELGENLSIETYCFFGRKVPTLSSGMVRYAAGGNWKNITWEINASGDGTVPEQSAVFPMAHTQYPFCDNHGDIYVNPAALDILEWELYGKYLLGKQARTSPILMQFTIDKDIYSPGEKINIKINIKDEEGKRMAMAVSKTQSSLEWRQPLPGNELVVPHLSSPQEKLSLVDGQNPGEFNGQLIAPDIEGYYSINITSDVNGHQSLVHSELIAIDGYSNE